MSILSRKFKKGNRTREKIRKKRVLHHTREMDFTGRPMKGMIYVEPDGYESDDDLSAWVRRAARFAASLPGK